jgi:two-component system response regulator FixJ
VRNSGPLVYLVDDDDAVRDSLGLLLRSIGLECQLYASALEFLEHYDPKRHACLVADIRMPGLSGLELQQRLNEQSAEIPIIFITGHGDVPMAVNAMKAGATDFIQKPFRDQDLIDRIHKALDTDKERRAARAEEDTIRARLALHDLGLARRQSAHGRTASRARHAQAQDALARRARARGRQDRRRGGRFGQYWIPLR